MPSSQRTSSVVLRASCPRDAHQGDPGDMSSPGRASSVVSSLPPAKCQYQESLSPLRPCSAPLLATSDSRDPEYSAELEAQARMSVLDQQSKLSKVTWERGASVAGSILEPVSQSDRCTPGQPPLQGERLSRRYCPSCAAQPKC